MAKLETRTQFSSLLSCCPSVGGTEEEGRLPLCLPHNEAHSSLCLCCNFVALFHRKAGSPGSPAHLLQGEGNLLTWPSGMLLFGAREGTRPAMCLPFHARGDEIIG